MRGSYSKRSRTPTHINYYIFEALGYSSKLASIFRSAKEEKAQGKKGRNRLAVNTWAPNIILGMWGIPAGVKSRVLQDSAPARPRYVHGMGIGRHMPLPMFPRSKQKSHVTVFLPPPLPRCSIRRSAAGGGRARGNAPLHRPLAPPPRLRWAWVGGARPGRSPVARGRRRRRRLVRILSNVTGICRYIFHCSHAINTIPPAPFSLLGTCYIPAARARPWRPSCSRTPGLGKGDRARGYSTTRVYPPARS